jgi:hypothetical protein
MDNEEIALMEPGYLIDFKQFTVHDIKLIVDGWSLSPSRFSRHHRGISLPAVRFKRVARGA